MLAYGIAPFIQFLTHFSCPASTPVIHSSSFFRLWTLYPVGCSSWHPHASLGSVPTPGIEPDSLLSKHLPDCLVFRAGWSVTPTCLEALRPSLLCPMSRTAPAKHWALHKYLLSNSCLVLLYFYSKQIARDLGNECMGFWTKTGLDGRQRVRDHKYRIFPMRLHYSHHSMSMWVSWGGGLCDGVSMSWYLLMCPPSCPETPLLCLIHGRCSTNAALIEFDLFELYVYPVISFDMPSANLAWITGSKLTLATGLRENVF